MSAEFAGGNGARTAAGVITAGQWYHIALVKTPGAINSTTQIYVNGVLQTLGSASTNTPNIVSSPAAIGAWANYRSALFEGGLSDVRIYNYALSATQINQIYTTEVGWWPSVGGGSIEEGGWKLNEGSGSEAMDSSGNNNNGTWHGTPSGTSGYYSEGNSQIWGQFDGSTDYISSSANSGISGNAAFTLALWVNAEDVSSFRGVAGFGDVYTTLGAAGITLGLNGPGSVSAEFAGGNGARTAAGVITAGQWYHIAVVKTPGPINSTTQIYVNGVLHTLGSASTNTPNIVSFPASIGAWAGALIRKYRPELVITHDPTRKYMGHHDHRITGQVCMDAVFPYCRDHLFYPEHKAEGLTPFKVGEMYLTGAEEPNKYVDITETFDLKMKAIACHVSQVGNHAGDWENWVKTRRAQMEAMSKERGMPLSEAFHRIEIRR